MNLLIAIAMPLLRGAAVAALLAGLADAWSIALGGGADVQALTLGALLLATGWGACHRTASRPPARASFLWLAIGGCTLPMISGWAPWAGIFGALFVLPLRMLGARLSAFVECSDRRAVTLGAHAFGAALGLAWVAGGGLGFGGFVLAAVLTGVSTARAPEVPRGEDPEDLPPWSHVAQRFTGMALGAGLCWSFALLAPLIRAHDASDAHSDARAVLTLALLALLAWITLGAICAEHRAGAVLTASAAAAAAFILPLSVSNWLQFSQPIPFDSLLRLPLWRSLFQTEVPRLSEQHFAYVPLMICVGAGLPILLLATSVRGWLGTQPSGPLRLAPLLMGAGIASVIHSLPLFEGSAGVGAIGFAAACALTLAALGMLISVEFPLAPRLALTAVILLAAGWLLRPPPQPTPAFSVLETREWSTATTVDGTPLQEAARGALWRVIESSDAEGERFQRLVRGRNLLTPELDTDGAWTREHDFALAMRPGARRMLLAGALHPASLRAAARAGVQEAVYAGDEAAVRLLQARDPGGYGLGLLSAGSIARAPGRFDLILLRSGALWDEDLPLLRASVAAQAARKLAPQGFCLLALGPEQLAPGIFPALIAAWREIFPRVTLYVVPDGLRGARLLLAAANHLDGEWPALLRAMQLSPQEIAEVERDASRTELAPPLPRVRGTLANSVFRLADGLDSVRRAASVLDELLPAPSEGSELPPSLLRAYALHYAAQEYSAHDDLLTPGNDAIEVRDPALTELLRLARAHPDSPWMRAIWSDAASTLAAKREVALAEEFLRPLREELGWRETGISMALARAAAEMLDEADARALLAEVLALEPAHAGARELLAALDAGSSLVPDAHAGHGHD